MVFGYAHQRATGIRALHSLVLALRLLLLALRFLALALRIVFPALRLLLPALRFYVPALGSSTLPEPRLRPLMMAGGLGQYSALIRYYYWPLQNLLLPRYHYR